MLAELRTEFRKNPELLAFVFGVTITLIGAFLNFLSLIPIAGGLFILAGLMFEFKKVLEPDLFYADYNSIAGGYAMMIWLPAFGLMLILGSHALDDLFVYSFFLLFALFLRSMLPARWVGTRAARRFARSRKKKQKYYWYPYAYGLVKDRLI